MLRARLGGPGRLAHVKMAPKARERLGLVGSSLHGRLWFDGRTYGKEEEEKNVLCRRGSLEVQCFGTVTYRGGLFGDKIRFIFICLFIQYSSQV